MRPGETLQQPFARIALATALLMGTAACSRIEDGVRDPRGTVIELCEGAERNLPGFEISSQPLAPVPAELRPSNGVKTVAFVEFDDKSGEESAYLTYSPDIPEDLLEAIQRATDPLLLCAAKKLGLDVEYVLVRGKDTGHFEPAHTDRIQIGIGVGIESEDLRLFETAGGLILGASHELMHAYTQELLEASDRGDTEARQIVTGLYDIFSEDIRRGAEAFRATQGEATVQELLKAVQQGKIADSGELRDLIDKLRTTHGLDGSVNNPNERPSAFDRTRYLDTILKEAGVDPDSEVFKSLAEKYDAFVENYFGIIDESAAFPDALKNHRAGHPPDTFHEWVTSFLNRVRFGYHGDGGLIATINELRASADPSDRQRAEDYSAALDLLAWMTSRHAELHQSMPFSGQ